MLARMPYVPKRRKRRAPIPRKLPSQERAASTVDAIVTAVERVLEKHGIKGLNTNRVAEIAGVSVGTLYQYFPNKESLVAALQDRYTQQTIGLCRAALTSADTVPVPTLIERIAVAILAAYEAQRPIHRSLVELRSAAGFHERRRIALDQIADELTAFLARRADLAVADARSTAFVLVHSVDGVVNATITRPGGVDLAGITSEMSRLLRAYTAP
jgi:AcrR family transcriptional regulator